MSNRYGYDEGLGSISLLRGNYRRPQLLRGQMQVWRVTPYDIKYWFIPSGPVLLLSPIALPNRQATTTSSLLDFPNEIFQTTNNLYRYSYLSSHSFLISLLTPPFRGLALLEPLFPSDYPLLDGTDRAPNHWLTFFSLVVLSPKPGLMGRRSPKFDGLPDMATRRSC